MDHVIAGLLGLPDWAPKALKSVAALVLAGVLVLAPGTFNRGVTLFVTQTQHHFEQIMQPILNDLVEPPPNRA